MAIIQPPKKALPPPQGRVVVERDRRSQAPAARRVAPPAQPANYSIPKTFGTLTAAVLMCATFTIAALLDVADAQYEQYVQRQLVEEHRVALEYAINDLVKDEMAYESTVNFVDRRPRVAAQAAPSGIERSPQQLSQKVLSIITAANKKLSNPRRLAMEIVSESLRQSYDPLFVAAVIQSESAFNQFAVSNKGAQGLMQIMPRTGKYLEEAHDIKWPVPAKLTDSGYNLHLGIKYLRELEKMYHGNRLLTLIAYNWGPGKLDRAIKSGRGVPAECLRYALKILRDHQRWEGSSALA